MREVRPKWPEEQDDMCRRRLLYAQAHADMVTVTRTFIGNIQLTGPASSDEGNLRLAQPAAPSYSSR